MKSGLKTFLIAFVTASVTASAPAIAHGVQHALFAHNADKVDGKHAVGSGASSSQRAGKLVATASNGKLPNNIISKAPNSELLDGLDSTAFLGVGDTATNSAKLGGIDAEQWALLADTAAADAGTVLSPIDLSDGAIHTLGSVEFIPPSTGWVVVVASGSMSVSHTAGTLDRFEGNLSTTAAAGSSDMTVVETPAAIGSESDFDQPFTVTTFLPVDDVGISKTIYLNGRMANGASAGDVVDYNKVTAIFVGQGM